MTTKMWWDTARIQETVTRQFIYSNLSPFDCELISRPVVSRGGLTDRSYGCLILERAKRIFLILLDLGCPERIFAALENSWDDNDLPLDPEQAQQLLSSQPDGTKVGDRRLERSFCERQFKYLLRFPRKGEHLTYQPLELVPLDIAREPWKPLRETSSKIIDSVSLPQYPGQTFERRRFRLASLGGGAYVGKDEICQEIEQARTLQSVHLVSYFCSYQHQDHIYVLFEPASASKRRSLRTLLRSTTTDTASPVAFVRRTRPRRNGGVNGVHTQPLRVLNWVNCLAGTLCMIHGIGLAHGNIKPSTIMVRDDEDILLSDFTRLNPSVLARAEGLDSFDNEAYNYAAPEQWIRTTSSLVRDRSLELPHPAIRTDESRNFGIPRASTDSDRTRLIGSPLTAGVTAPGWLDPRAADVFSLGCIILEMLGLLLGISSKAFAEHRAAKQKTHGRGSSIPDSSYHRNLGQVEGWMEFLAKKATSQDRKDMTEGSRDVNVFAAVVPLLHMTARMLAVNAMGRPSMEEVERETYQILTEVCGIDKPHCISSRNAYAQAEPTSSQANGNCSIPTAAFPTVITSDEESEPTMMAVLRTERTSSPPLTLCSGLEKIRDLRIKSK
ncbi:serine/threonine protein kinase [Pyricularia oryzae 70-15]|uniref:non-specific serine/threonine protein kinase n=3 Tax=Pyricularia oryzae TaxID=318829 RepID=G4NAB1_PYRO7|nr:serine/threonine protein kinase [Pyricularia oryzae 70-15]EHA50456.1 serine/threonine protein kinase [Pyricularia oryzae 70-15]